VSSDDSHLRVAASKGVFLFEGHNSAKNHSNGKPVSYAQVLEVPINPVKFHLNCFSNINPRQNLKIKGHNSDEKSLNQKMPTICTTSLSTDHFCKVWMKLHQTFMRRSPDSFVIDGRTDRRRKSGPNMSPLLSSRRHKKMR
jgi:hypothetical protein